MRKLLDAYGNQFNAVPNPNIAINDVLSDMKALEEIEARQGILADALADRQKKAADISTASQQFFQTKDDLHITLVDLAGQLKTQYQVVQGLEDTLRVKK
jgi:histidinol phosphatase-like enzyme